MQTISETPSGWLQSQFLKRRRKNSAYSLRAFARFLEIPSGRLSELFSKKRRLTIKMANKMASRLALTPEERERFLSCVTKKSGRSTSSKMELRPPAYHQLSRDAFLVISDWYHYALLSLIELDAFQPYPRWIARQLGISVVEVRAALERLIRLKLITTTGETYRRTALHLTTTHDIVSSGLRKFHAQNLKNALASLEEVSVGLRDITSMTMAIDIEKLGLAKRMIKRFRRNLARVLESERKNAVYTLNIQLLPLTKPENNYNHRGNQWQKG